MDEILLDGAGGLRVRLRRSARARRMSLRVSGLDGAVTLTVPRHVGDRAARAFAEDQRAWIAQARSALPDRIEVRAGAQIPVLGRMTRIVASPVRSARLTEDELAVPQNRPAGPGVRAFLKLAARARLADAVTLHAGRIGRAPGGLTLRDTRSRWGSCSSSGGLSFSWRLIMAPSEVLDYVAAHEVAHLREMNHGPDFWRLVETLCPDYRSHRRWLKVEGTALHRYDFGG